MPKNRAFGHKSSGGIEINPSKELFERKGAIWPLVFSAAC
jgi:hypothetical protein